MKLFSRIILVSVFAMFLAGNAMALQITFDDGNTGTIDLTVVDNDINDTNSLLDGVVTYAGNIGSWMLNTTVGTSYPAIGSLSAPELDLFSLTLGGSGTIAVSAEDTYATVADLDAGISGFVASIGGTTDGTVDLKAYINGNLIDIPWGDMSVSVLGNAFSASESYSGYLGDPSDTFDLKMTAIVTQTTGITTLDAHIKPIPEPATMFLLGFGLLGLAGVARKKTV